MALNPDSILVTNLALMGSRFIGFWEMWSASLSEYVMLNSDGRHLMMAWLRVVLRIIFCTVEMLW